MRILDRVPLREQPGEAVTPDGPALVLPYQVLVTVSIAPWRVRELPPDATRFPAVAIRREQWDRWTGLSLPRHGQVSIGGRIVPLLAANVWIHPNTKAKPFKLELQEGVAVYPTDIPNPARLPIPGLRGLVRNRLRLTIDGDRKTVSLVHNPSQGPDSGRKGNPAPE
jgi:hypothetical protein